MGVSYNSLNKKAPRLSASLNPILFIRKEGYDASLKEINAAKKYFTVINNLDEVSSGENIIGRFSLRPFYQDIEKEIKNKNSDVLLPYEDFLYIEDIRRWYQDLKDFTPRTWSLGDDIDSDGPFFIKGITNSLKHEWDKSFVKNKDDLEKSIEGIKKNPLLENQDIVIREYIPLRKLGESPKGMPISEEYRLFVLNSEVLVGGFYWSDYKNLIKDADWKKIPEDFIKQVINKVPVRYYVLDIGIKEDGTPIVIELNDPGMSGLCDIDVDEFYKNLSQKLI